MPPGAPALSEVPTLFSGWFCPYAQRVLIAAHAKKLLPHCMSVHEVSFDELFGNKPQWLDLNPDKCVPFLAWNTTSSSGSGSGGSSGVSSSGSSGSLLPGVASSDGGAAVVRESLVINEYLEDRYPDPPLLPRDPEGRAAARLMVQRVAEGFVPAFKRVVSLQHASEQQQAEAAAQLDEEMTWLCSHMCPEGPFALSQQLSLVDCAVVPHLLRLYILRHYARYRYQGPHQARLRAYLAAARAHPAVAASLVHPDPALDFREELLKVYARFAVSLVFKGHSPLW